MKRPNLSDQKHWVKVSDVNQVVHFETFDEAVKSEIRGHLMSLTYYKYHYSKM
jgi:hypothetical protein